MRLGRDGYGEGLAGGACCFCGVGHAGFEVERDGVACVLVVFGGGVGAVVEQFAVGGSDVDAVFVAWAWDFAPSVVGLVFGDV